MWAHAVPRTYPLVALLSYVLSLMEFLLPGHKYSSSVVIKIIKLEMLWWPSASEVTN